MFTKITDALLAFIFIGTTAFGIVEFYGVVKKATLAQIDRGLSSTYTYTQRLTGERFDWER